MSVARQAAHGVAWNMLFGVGSRVLQLVGTLILTHFIATDDYGAVLNASVMVVTAGTFTSFAFGQYLIAKRSPPEIAAQVMVVHVGLGLVAMGAVCALSGPIGDFYGTPATSDYVYGFAISVMLDRLRYVPERLILRGLQFRKVAAIKATGELAFTIAALATARMWGGHAIVFGWLVRSALTCVLFFRAAPNEEWMVRARLRAADVRDLFRYTLPLMIGSISDFAATRWDNIIVSKLFGAGVMARYNQSYSLAEMPVNSIAEQIGEVLMPSFSKMEGAQRQRAVVRAAALMSLVVSPFAVGLGAIAPTLVAALFNADWQASMAPMLAILSITGVFRPTMWSAIAYLQAVQQTRLIMYSSFLRAVAVLGLVAGFGYGGGPVWACIGAGIGFALHAVLTIVAAGRAVGYSVGEYMLGVARPIVASVPMYLAVRGAERGLDAAGVPLVASLAVQVAVGAVVYVASAFVFARSDVNEVLRLGRDALRRRRR